MGDCASCEHPAAVHILGDGNDYEPDHCLRCSCTFYEDPADPYRLTWTGGQPPMATPTTTLPAAASAALSSIGGSAPVTTHTKRPRLSKEEYQKRKEAATLATGYDNSSPIWGKTTLDVLELVRSHVYSILGETLLPSVADDMTEIERYVDQLIRREQSKRLTYGS